MLNRYQKQMITFGIFLIIVLLTTVGVVIHYQDKTRNAVTTTCKPTQNYIVDGSAVPRMVYDCTGVDVDNVTGRTK